MWCLANNRLLFAHAAQAPVITSVQVNNPRSLTVTWTTIAASSGYIIYRYIPSASGSPTTGTLKNVTVAGTSNTSYTFSGLTPYDYTSNVGVTFALTVAAYFDLSILPTDFGDSSIVVTATLPCMLLPLWENHNRSASAKLEIQRLRLQFTTNEANFTYNCINNVLFVLASLPSPPTSQCALEYVTIGTTRMLLLSAI